MMDDNSNKAPISLRRSERKGKYHLDVASIFSNKSSFCGNNEVPEHHHTRNNAKERSSSLAKKAQKISNDKLMLIGFEQEASDESPPRASKFNDKKFRF